MARVLLDDDTWSPFVDAATQAELDAEAASRATGDTSAVSTAEGYTDAQIAALGSASTHDAADFDAAGAAAAAQAASQPIDSDLTAIAALTTTAYGRALLELANAAALRTAAGLGTLATQSGTFSGTSSGTNTGDQDLSGLQPLDSDLTAIAALTTTSYGRAFLALADAAAGRTALGLGTAATSASSAFDAAGAAAAAQAASQPLDSDLTAIAALTTTTFGRAFLALADAAAGRTALSLGTLATQSGTFSGTSSGTNTGDQTITLTSDVTATGTGSMAATLVGTANVEAIIRANTLDQMSPPTGAVAFNSQRATGLGTAVASTDAVTLGQIYDGVYGDGSDGALTFDGVTTVAGLAPAGGTTYVMTRDLYATDCTISNGIKVWSAGFRLFGTGTLTGPGTIEAGNVFKNGGSFSAGTGGQAAASSTLDGGQSGGNGATGASATTTGRTTCLGGRGGAGGNGTSGSGTTAGTVTAPTAALGNIRTMPYAVTGVLFSATTLTLTAVGSGTGGASGAGDGTNKGGAGGASGAMIVVAFRNIASTNAVTITAVGGNGESPAAGNTGGGGGGGGGVVVVISKNPTNPTVVVSGGTKGTKHGTGTDGVNGSAGTSVLIAA